MATSTPRQKDVYYSDFLFNLNKNPNTNDLVRVTNEQSVINSIKKILKTNHFEIPYNPYFGANLYLYLFEPFLPTTEMQIKNEIQFAIENFEPRAEVLDIIVNGRPDDNALDITLTISIINNPTPVTVATTLVRVR
jgi:phage baseplate assembly protein W